MKIIAPLLQTALLTVLASCTNNTGVNQTPVSYQGGGSPLSGQVFQDVNTYRRNRGARELQRHAGLDRLAMEHCEYLRKNRGTFNLYGKNVSHDGAEGRALIAMKSLRMMSTSENVASTMKAGSDARTSMSLLTLWQKSHAHEEAMRNPAWTHTGVGTLVDADGRVFATQLFATANNSQMAMQERFNRF